MKCICISWPNAAGPQGNSQLFRGDKDIYVYETDAKGKLWRRHKFSGHEGWVTQLHFLADGADRAAVLASGSEDASVRLWCLVRGTLLRDTPASSMLVFTCGHAGSPSEQMDANSDKARVVSNVIWVINVNSEVMLSLRDQLETEAARNSKIS